MTKNYLDGGYTWNAHWGRGGGGGGGINLLIVPAVDEITPTATLFLVWFLKSKSHLKLLNAPV